MNQVKTGFVILSGLVFFLAVSAAAAQDSVIEKRQKLMKSNSAATKAIKKAVAGKDYAAIEAKAKTISKNMDQIVDLFPKGSVGDNSRAKPDIWKKWDEFSKKPVKVKEAAQALVEAAKAKDDSRITAEFKAVGSGCGSCHKPFRAPKKK